MDKLMRTHTSRDQSQPSGSRAPRSRLDRPCDACRRHKHLCIIPVREEPCVGCRTRNKNCTFDAEPLARAKKRARVLPTTPASAVAAYSSASSPSTSYVRTGRTHNTGLSSEISEPRGDIMVVNGDNHDPRLRSTSTWYTADPSSASPSTSAIPGTIPPPSRVPRPLDMEDDDTQESHFLGAVAHSGFTVRETPSSTGDSIPNTDNPFRQVSSDPRTPVFFVKNPSLLYGRTPNSGREIYEAVCRICEGDGHNIPSKALAKLRQVTLPAMPFINFQRLESACLGLEGNGPIPYAMLAGIIAHCNSYIPEIRHLNTELWSQALLGLDDEYRLPRLATLQLALLQLCSRPQERGENIGQGEIALARAIGTAHLLGLHIDPTNWSIPQWERTLRKRIWWSLYVQDKWRALIFGRPRIIHTGDHKASLPTISDTDDGSSISCSDRSSMESFIATCRLTFLIDKVLETFCKVELIFEPTSYLTRLALLESYITELNEYENSLPEALLFQPDQVSPLAPLPTGIRSFQLSYLGLRVIIHRLLLDAIPSSSTIQNPPVLQNAFEACQLIVKFTQNLRPFDRDSFWNTLSAHHFFNAISLLLRIAVRTRTNNIDTYIQFDPVGEMRSLLEALGEMYGSDWKWEIAGVALRRALGLFNMVDKDFPNVREMCEITERILGIQPRASSEDPATAFYTSFGLEELNPSLWPGNDLFWLSDFQSLPGGEEGGL